MVLAIGDGLVLNTALTGTEDALNGTVLTTAEFGTSFTRYQTDATITGSDTHMNGGDEITIDTDGDLDLSDETALTQAGNDRYAGSTVEMDDGTIFTGVQIELVTLSDGSQIIFFQKGPSFAIKANGGTVEKVTLGTFDDKFDNYYNQGNFAQTFICFARGTRILTRGGEINVEDLSAGMQVITRDKGPQTVQWAGSHMVSSDDLQASQKNCPIRIQAGALGAGFPAHDLVVSPQHRIMIRSKIAERLFGAAEIFVQAKKLVDIEGVSQTDGAEGVEYFHILLDAHHVLLANGLPCESLLPGPEAINTMYFWSAEDKNAELPSSIVPVQAATTCRPYIQRNSLVKKLVTRHMKNDRALIDMEFVAEQDLKSEAVDTPIRNVANL